MKALYDLKDKLNEELEEIARKPDMSAGDLETVHKLTDTIKNIDKICALEEGGEYSMDGDWEASMRGNYGRSHSYRGRRRDSRGRYSRDGNTGGGNYSRGGNDMMERLEDMMDEAKTEKERTALRRAIEMMK